VTATALLDELSRRGARVEVVEGELHVRPRRAVLDLAPAIQRHARELAAAVVAVPALPEPRVWIIASEDPGEMRLAVASEPPWPDAVFRAAALVEVIDRHHRAGEDKLAEAAAIQLETAIARLRDEGIESWLTS
jgi:hypothetical protein